MIYYFIIETLNLVSLCIIFIFYIHCQKVEWKNFCLLWQILKIWVIPFSLGFHLKFLACSFLSGLHFCYHFVKKIIFIYAFLWANQNYFWNQLNTLAFWLYLQIARHMITFPIAAVTQSQTQWLNKRQQCIIFGSGGQMSKVSLWGCICPGGSEKNLFISFGSWPVSQLQSQKHSIFSFSWNSDSLL